MNTQRIEWIDTAKVITMLLVIIGHCRYYVMKTSFGGIDYLSGIDDFSLIHKCEGYLVNFIYSFHMPLFFMLSGMCFYMSMIKKNILLKRLITSKIKRLIIPFICVSLFLSIPLKYISGYWASSGSILYDIFCGQILLMGNSHLWFVVSLFWMFIVIAVTEKIPANKHMLLLLLFVSWIGFYVEQNTNIMGIPGAMKHLIFFYFGFKIFPLINSQCLFLKKRLVVFLSTCSLSLLF